MVRAAEARRIAAVAALGERSKLVAVAIAARRREASASEVEPGHEARREGHVALVIVRERGKAAAERTHAVAAGGDAAIGAHVAHERNRDRHREDGDGRDAHEVGEAKPRPGDGEILLLATEGEAFGLGRLVAIDPQKSRIDERVERGVVGVGSRHRLEAAEDRERRGGAGTHRLGDAIELELGLDQGVDRGGVGVAQRRAKAVG